MTNGQILSLLLALSKGNGIEYNGVNIAGIATNATKDGLIFILQDGKRIEHKFNSVDAMKLSDFDKNKDGIIDIAEVCNVAKNSEKLGGNSPSFYAKATEIPRKISQLENDSGFVKINDLDESGIIPKDANSQNKLITNDEMTKKVSEIRFSELLDVDVVNIKDKQIVAFSSDTGKFTAIDGIIDIAEVCSIAKNSEKLGGNLPSFYAKTTEIPKKISQLVNDSGFVKLDNLDELGIIPNDTKDGLIFILQDGKRIEHKFNSADAMKLSDFDKNKDGIIDIAEVCNIAKDSERLGGKLPSSYAKTTEIPKKISQLENDSGFVKINNLDDSGIIPKDVDSKNKLVTNNEMIKKISEIKFSELLDVDVVNIKDKQIVTFSSDTGKFTAIDGIEAADAMKLSDFDKNKDGIIDIAEVCNIAKDSERLGGKLPSSYAKTTEIPRKISQLENDSGFIKCDNLDELGIIPNDTKDGLIFILQDGKRIEHKFNSADAMKLSDFDKNRDGIIDTADVCNVAKNSEKLGDKLPSFYAKTTEIPKKISQLENDSEFIKLNDLDELGIIPKDENSQNKLVTNDEMIKKISEIKFSELLDVDVVNIKDKQIVTFSSDTGKFTTIDGIEAGELTGAGLKQIKEMGVIGTPQNPKIISIPINTVDFKVPRINVLRYELGEHNITTKNEFSSNNFKEDENIIFDGKVHLKLEHEFKYNIEDAEGYTEYSTIIDLDQFKIINKFEEFEDGVMKKLKLKGIPHDRILTPKDDMNLSNVEHIDYFKLNAIDKNLRIICSVDGGKTWKTFKSEKWIDVNLELQDIKDNGMTKDLFNNINAIFWDELVTTKKIRFAYLISMDDMNYMEELESLLLKYDGQGKWVQAKETDFDVVYSSNTLLQVYIKFDGNIKINY